VEPGKFPIWKVWDCDSGLELSTLHDYQDQRALTILPDNRRLVTQSFSSGYLCDLETGQRLRKVEAGSGVFSPDCRRFCSSYLGKVMDFENDRVVATLRGRGDRSTPSGFSPDGRRVWTSSVDGTARLWDTETGRELLTLKT